MPPYFMPFRYAAIFAAPHFSRSPSQRFSSAIAPFLRYRCALPPDHATFLRRFSTFSPFATPSGAMSPAMPPRCFAAFTGSFPLLDITPPRWPAPFRRFQPPPLLISCHYFIFSFALLPLLIILPPPFVRRLPLISPAARLRRAQLSPLPPGAFAPVCAMITFLVFCCQRHAAIFSSLFLLSIRRAFSPMPPAQPAFRCQMIAAILHSPPASADFFVTPAITPPSAISSIS